MSPVGAQSPAGSSPVVPAQKRRRVRIPASTAGDVPGYPSTAPPPPAGPSHALTSPQTLPQESATPPVAEDSLGDAASTAASASQTAPEVPRPSSATLPSIAARTAAALALVAVGAGVAGSGALPQKRDGQEEGDASQRAADVAEKRRQAQRARGLGADAAAQVQQQASRDSASSQSGIAEHFGYNARDRLRRDLEKRRRGRDEARATGAVVPREPSASAESTDPGQAPGAPGSAAPPGDEGTVGNFPFVDSRGKWRFDCNACGYNNGASTAVIRYVGFTATLAARTTVMLSWEILRVT